MTTNTDILDNPELITRFSFSTDDEDLYLEENCGALALALSSELNVPILGIKHNTDILHYVVYYNDKYIDIMGEWCKDSLLEYWQAKLEDDSYRNAKYRAKLIEIDASNLSQPDYYVSMNKAEIKTPAREIAMKIISLL